MSRSASPTLIGAFVIGALALGVFTILLLSGGPLFQHRPQQVLYFEEAAQGLQVGAPVVLLGVKVGTVKRIELDLERDSCKFLVPVTIEIEPSLVRTLEDEQVDLGDPQTLKQLIDRGLRAQLRIQSLLTGQLYVGLDFYPDKPARFFATDPSINEVPTIPTTVKELTLKLEEFPMEKFLNDIVAISEALKTLLGAQETAELPKQLNRTLQHLEALSKKLDQQSAPLLSDLRADLRALDDALAAVKLAADRVAALADPERPLYSSLTRASDDLAAASRAMQALSRDDAPVVVHLDMMLQELTRAARTLRSLAESLDQQPEALFWGKHPEQDDAQR